MENALSIIAIILSAISVAITMFTFFWTAKRDKKQATLDAYNLLQEQALDYINDYMPAQIEDIAKNPKSEEFKKISKYLARIEHFCVGVNRGIYDKNVVFDLAAGYLDQSVYKRVSPIIAQKQKGQTERFYDDYERLVTWMKNKRGVE